MPTHFYNIQLVRPSPRRTSFVITKGSPLVSALLIFSKIMCVLPRMVPSCTGLSLNFSSISSISLIISVRDKVNS